MNLTEFNAALEREFQGRLRARWSAQSREYHIEQKVGRGLFAPPRRNEDTEGDRWIRARDGYELVMRIRLGDRMPCPKCGLTLKVPVLQIRETVCGHCQSKKRDGRMFAAYFPLGRLLIEHLYTIDPHRDAHKRQLAEADANNAKLQEGDDGGLLYDVLHDELMTQIPKVGYTGPGAR